MASKAEEPESPDDILWVRNEDGGVHDVTREHADRHLYETTNSGNRFLLPGWSFITAEEARQANPQLFGVPDPLVVYNAKERQEIIERRKFEADEAAANAAAAGK